MQVGSLVQAPAGEEGRIYAGAIGCARHLPDGDQLGSDSQGSYDARGGGLQVAKRLREIANDGSVAIGLETSMLMNGILAGPGA